jgi:hypothetical protein
VDFVVADRGIDVIQTLNASAHGPEPTRSIATGRMDVGPRP